MSEKQQQEKRPVMMKCKRGNDRTTEGQSCMSLSAFALSPHGSQAPRFKCKKCGFEWIVPVGGKSPI